MILELRLSKNKTMLHILSSHALWLHGTNLVRKKKSQARAGFEPMTYVILVQHCRYTSIIYVNCGWRNKNRSNPRSYEYYFITSSEIKVWKKFRSLWDLNPWPLWYRYYCILFFFFNLYIFWQIIDKPPIKSIATSPKWFTSPATSFPCTLSVFSDSFWPLKKKLLLGKRYWESERSALPKNTAKLPRLQLEPHLQMEDLGIHT